MKKIFLLVLYFSRQIYFTVEYQYENRSKNIQPVAFRFAEQDIPVYSCRKFIFHYFNIKIYSLVHCFWLSPIRSPPLLFK